MRDFGVGFEPRPGSPGESNVVCITQPDWAKLHDLADEIRERIEARKPIEELLHRLAMEESAQATAAVMDVWIDKAMFEWRPAAILAWQMGKLRAMNLTQLAQKYGVKKQAIQQEAVRLYEELGLRPTRYMRHKSAKLKMRLRNFRKHAVPGFIDPVPR